MKKPFKIMSSATLASVFAVSSLVPVAAAADVTEVPAEAKQLDSIILKSDNQLLSLEVNKYQGAFNAGLIKGSDVNSVQAKDGSTYLLKDYLSAFNAEGTVEGALELLYKNNKQALNLDVKEGQIVDGQLVPKDEQPEDRLNETFFYNVA